jgi:ABC-type sugar transport system substrate-binding protein
MFDADLVWNPYCDNGKYLAIKPDGTPYHIAFTCFGPVNYWMTEMIEPFKELCRRSGASYVLDDPGVDVANQIAFIENQIPQDPDWLMVMPLNEQLVVPACEKAAAAGIPYFAVDLAVNSDTVTSYIYHDFDSDKTPGTDLLGEYLVGEAEKNNRKINVFEIWGDRSTDRAHSASEGMHKIIDQHELVEITQLSPDTMWSDELTAQFVMDAFTAHPELNSCFLLGGGGLGALEGLETIGRIKPYGDPEFVWVVDCNGASDISIGIEEGERAALITHGSRDLTDILMKQAFLFNVIGSPVVQYQIVPMLLVTQENYKTAKEYGGPAAYHLVEGFEVWPVLNSENIGVPTPTLQMRMDLQGY